MTEKKTRKAWKANAPTEILPGPAPGRGQHASPQSQSARSGAPTTLEPLPGRQRHGLEKPAPPAETRLLHPGSAAVDAISAAQSDPAAQPANSEPFAAWLVVIDGPGRGSFRLIRYGNNAIGRDDNQRIPLNFGDDAISRQDHAFIRYVEETRTFEFIPNLARPNIVKVNDTIPTQAVVLEHGDELTLGETRLRFIPLCGKDFDWSDQQNLEADVK